MRLPRSLTTRKFSVSLLLRLTVLAILLVLPAWIGLKIVKTQHFSLWGPGFIKDSLTGARYGTNTDAEHFIFMMCDHWEPGYGGDNRGPAHQWIESFEEVSLRHRDSQGRPFQYTWFYPIDRFDANIIEGLAASSSRGFGEIEVHWHHYHATGALFEAELQTALKGFTRVGALVDRVGAEPKFAFIHGNWTLDNSGLDRFCGVDDEIQILLDNGCYADFTFPALGMSAQPRLINQIFYASDTPEPKSYDQTAIPAVVGQPGSGLMMVPGPFGLNLRNPRILMEYAALDDAEGSGISGRLFGPREAKDYFKKQRVGFWNRMAVGVAGKPEWVFVKIHAHGMLHQSLFFDGEMEAMLTAVEEYCEKEGLQLHYVTAREGYNLAKAAESGTTKSPEQLYDFVIPPPLSRSGLPHPVHPVAAPR